MSGGAEIRGLSLRYNDAPLLQDLSLTLAPGEFVCLLGRSGAGKSTVLKALAGLIPEARHAVRAPTRRGVAFQEPRLLPWRTALDNVALGLNGLNFSRAEKRRRAAAALAEVGLTERGDAWPATLSGGEAQRCALARALARDPDLLLLDEPFAALDALTRAQMQELLAALWARRRPATLMVTHDAREAALLADRCVILADGQATQVIVPPPRPRHWDDPALLTTERAILTALGAERP